MSFLISSTEITVDPSPSRLVDHAWTKDMRAYLQPEWEDLLEGEFARNLAGGSWSVGSMRGWILQLYPFIHSFPKFLAEGLLKVEDEYARSFLIDNIRVEKAHAEHWIWMGEGFGVSRQDMIALAHGERATLRDVQSLSDWLWYINAKGSLAEAVAATSFAIEGATGDIARTLLPGFEAYGSRPGITINPRTTKWLRNHSKYDDDHPRIALEVVTRYAKTERERMKVMAAARRSLQLLNLALVSACRAFADGSTVALREAVSRSEDRRRAQQPIGFPDRRIVDRRKGAAAETADIRRLA